ncbi:AAA domain-containing protein [Mesobacillus jeotgali]|uniref:AAA domain-containing protein n=1 Tax=Mesobacillus jeotgali TaxID=129985 RepID=UPI000C849399|nr:AAA domain-containing protein [Mesobacillus jeotgali]
MDSEHNLILIKNVDKTDQIDSLIYTNGKWRVRFKNNSKFYEYNYLNVTKLKDPKVLKAESTIVYDKDIPCYGLEKILDFGDYVRLIYKTGYKKVVPRTDVRIEEADLKGDAQKCLEYLRSLADNIGGKYDGEPSYLSKEYKALSTTSPRSVLAAYLKGRDPARENKQISPIFPFGFNLSQKAAVEKAMVEQVSLIEGPPGTGKTQTILNILANAVVNGHTVAVVSNNNSATANVVEKLQKYGVDFIAAYLGKNENQERFFAEQTNTLPDFTGWILPNDEFRNIKNELKESQRKLNQMLGYQNDLAVVQQRLGEFTTEQKYFEEYYKESNFAPIQLSTFVKLSADKVLKILMDYNQYSDTGKFTLKEKLYNFFAYGIYNFKIYQHSVENLISFLQKLYYQLIIKELQDEKAKLQEKLDSYNFNEAMKEFSDKSMTLFKAALAERYGKSRDIYRKDSFKKDFHKFIKDYPVVLSTTHSLRKSAVENFLFDYVIVDEASQVDLVAGALALSCAKKAVIVGDTKQLPNVVTKEDALVAKGIFERAGLDHAYSYVEQSLLTSILNLYGKIPKTLLKEHYRCHPKIIGFCNQKFYNNELIVLTHEKEDDKPLILYKTVKGNHARGTINQRQIDVVFEEIIPNNKVNIRENSVGLISPYRMQADKLQATAKNHEIQADTVHKYQGRERDIIILTTVSNEVKASDFVDNPNLVNVAVSRAVDQLIVVVSEGSEEWKGTNIGDLVRYIQYNNFEIIDSEIYSVFDLLYRSYSKKLLKELKSSKKVSKYQSENFMNNVIDKILSLPEFQNLSHVLHQPLRMLIKDTSKLTQEERKYALNVLTHTDFVIFNKVDKKPVLVVEVDGHAYHANNPIQLKRDRMKDSILKKYNIPIIRMETTGSNEETRLREKLQEVLR